MNKTVALVLSVLIIQLVGCSEDEKQEIKDVIKEELKGVDRIREKRKAEIDNTVRVFKSISFKGYEDDNRPSNSQEIINAVNAKRCDRIRKLEKEAKDRGEYIHRSMLWKMDEETAEYQEEQEILKYAYGGEIPSLF